MDNFDLEAMKLIWPFELKDSYDPAQPKLANLTDLDLRISYRISMFPFVAKAP
jgi:hypothetical protein